jgi:Glycosyl hydrolase family 26
MRRRAALAFTLSLLLCAVGAGMLTAPAGAGPSDPTIAFGAYAKPRSGQTNQQAVTSLEGSIGRQLALVRVFDLWDQPFPDPYTTWLRDTGHTLVLSVKAKRTNGSVIAWRAIADAAPGSALHAQTVSWATRVRDFGAPLHFTFHHEPEASTNLNNGVDADFIAAWRKVITVFRDQGVTNARFTWIMTANSFQLPDTDRRKARKWYPGDGYVDYLGADVYNWYNCRSGINNAWKPLGQLIEAFRQFGLAHPTERMMLAEWASYEDPATPNRKAQWIDGARALFKSPGYGQFDAILYFNSHDQTAPTCRWWVDTSQSSLTSFAAMATDPFYGKAP